MNAFRSNPISTGIAANLREPFVLLDIGCSGGIQPAWRAFAPNLRAFAFDPNVAEIERLRKAEHDSGIVYEEAFVSVPEGHKFSDKMKNADFVKASPWGRLSSPKSLSFRAQGKNDSDLAYLNLWTQIKLTANSVYIPEYVRSKQIEDIDFVKIDVDGADLIVLETIFESPLHSRILGMLLEVNFNGTADPDHNTFHNTDRLMRQMGFDLFELSVRTYSSGAMPWPYAIGIPAQAINGRPFQGDALYMRDLSASHMLDFSARLSADKLAKSAAVFALSGHFDQAAEVLETFSERLSDRFAVPEFLDQLALEVQKPIGSSLSRTEYLAAFAADSPMFYPGWSPPAPPSKAPTPPAAAGQPVRRKSAWSRVRRAIKRLTR
jgi:FkbM family methyltransferase